MEMINANAMRHQRYGNFRDILLLPRVNQSHFTSLTIKLNITSGYRVVALVEEPADVRVGIVCGRTLGCAGGGSFLDDFCVLPEFAFKLAISDLGGGRGKRRIPGRPRPPYYV
jgi:hypothetical protein